jgi:Ca2+-binding EF-hand superfamily protein
LGKDEAKEFDELTPEKSKERLAKLVPKMDLNGDGYIEENELREHINFMQKRYVVCEFSIGLSPPYLFLSLEQ